MLLGLGIGPTNSLFMLAVQNALPGDKLGTVTSVNQFFRQIGGTVGVTVFGAIITASVRTRLATGLPDSLCSLPPETRAGFASPNLLTDPGALGRTRVQVETVAQMYSRRSCTRSALMLPLGRYAAQLCRARFRNLPFMDTTEAGHHRLS